MNQNNGHHRLSAVDVIEEEPAPDQTGTSFYDATSPEFRPAKQIDVRRKKGWKRKLAQELIGAGMAVDRDKVVSG